MNKTKQLLVLITVLTSVLVPGLARSSSALSAFAGSHDLEGANVFHAQSSLWIEPVDIESRNLFYGIGGADGAPNPAHRFTFIAGKDPLTGERMALDEAGRTWLLITGPEARAETAASRLAWAVGYHVDQSYFLPSLHVGGGGGDLFAVRLKRKDDGYTRVGTWNWTSNPFSQTRELQGLMALMALFSNWKLPAENNMIVTRGDITRFYVTAMKTSFGKSAKLESNSSSANATHYSDQKFVDKVKNGQVVFHMKGGHASVVRGVSVENAVWLGSLLARLSDAQIADAFRAAGFAPVEIALFRLTVRRRINELRNLNSMPN